MRKIFDEYICVAAVTPKIKVANCVYNAKIIAGIMEEAKAKQVKLLCLPELCITGSTCGDLFFQPALIDSAKMALDKLVEYSRGKDMIVVAGLPIAHMGKLYNVAAVFSQGQILGFVPKTNVSGPFSAPCKQRGMETISWYGSDIPFGTDILFANKNISDFTFAVEIGTDLLAPIPPSTRHALSGAVIIVNPAATPEFADKSALRRTVVTSQSLRLMCGYVYANAGCGESTTDAIFGGHNIVTENGVILQESLPFGNEGWAVTEIDLEALVHDRKKNIAFYSNPDNYITIPFSLDTADEKKLMRKIDPLPFIKCEAEEALAIQAAGLAKRIEHTDSCAVIGVSGGLDSCLALLVTVRAYRMLGKPVSEIVAVTMPCFGTTSHTKNNAHSLCEAFGIPCREIDITASVTQHLKDIDHPQDKFDVVFENAQARMRTYVLMDLANQVNGLVIGTGSLSELALGWATYNGDHMSMYAVNAGVPKTLVRLLVQHTAENPDKFLKGQSPIKLKYVLDSILATKVSPELLPAHNDEITQITEELVGPYELHDFFIYHTLRFSRRPKTVLNLAKLAFVGKYTGDEILHWLKTFYRRFFSQQFKRNCLPDAPQVVEISLSPRGGFQMPSDAMVDVWLQELPTLY